MRLIPPGEDHDRAASELYARAVRSISVMFLPFMALPLGMAAKRGRKAAGFIFAAVVFLLYQYAIDMAQALADLGVAKPEAALGLPFGLFVSLCLGLFATSRRRPGETPLSVIVERVAGGLERARKIVTRRPAGPHRAA
jgi:lipopolysaccharide export system permease protein